MNKYIPPSPDCLQGRVQKETKLGVIIEIGKADSWGTVPYTLKLDDGTVIIVDK